jgi:hypothetical protein
MTAFAAAVDALFADPNLGSAATYEPADGDPFPVRVIARRADAITDFGEARLWSETTRFDVRVAEGGEPASGRSGRDRRRDLRRPGRAGARPRAAGLDTRLEAGVKLKLDIRPDLVAMMKAEIAAGERAVTAAMREAGTGLKLAWRGQIVGAGLGPRLANSIRSEVFPKAGVSLNAAAVVWSKAPVIVGAHDAGPLIRSNDGFWLAIPTPAAGKALGGRRITPGAWERKTGLRLRFVYRRVGPSLLVADSVRLNSRGQAAVSRSKTGRGQVTAPIFLLVPQAKLQKRLDLARDAERAHEAVPGLIVANWVV